MSAVQDVPGYANPVEIQPGGKVGRFSNNWIDWFIKLARGLQDKQSELPQATPGLSSSFAGPGPIASVLTVVARRQAILTITMSVVQSFVTSAPTWSLTIIVDSQVFTTGTINAWQPVVTISKQFLVEPGSHAITGRWTTSSANGIIQNLLVSASYAYT